MFHLYLGIFAKIDSHKSFSNRFAAFKAIVPISPLWVSIEKSTRVSMALRLSFHQWLLRLFLALLPRLPLLNPEQFVHLSLHLPKLQYHRQLLDVFVSKVIPNKVLIALPQLVNWTLEYREGVIIFIWHIFLKTALRKQSRIVLSGTSLQEWASIFIASSIEFEGIYFPLSIAFMIVLIMRVRYLHFNDRMTPWSIGCKQEVVFGGRKYSAIDLRFSIFRWVVQLAITNATLRPSNTNSLSCSLNHSSNNLESIQLFFCARHRHGVLLIPLKQRTLFDFPITSIGIFSTCMLAAARPVSWILLFLPPLHFSPFKCILFVGRAL